MRECDAGIKMGVASIDDVLDYVQNASFRESLTECKKKHEQIKEEILHLLKAYHDDGKNPNPIAKGMASVKTDLKLTMRESDQTIADLITDEELSPEYIIPKKSGIMIPYLDMLQKDLSERDDV